MPAADGFEYATLAALDAAWPETDTMGAVSTWSIETSVVDTGVYAAELAVVGTTPASQDSYRTRTFTGLAPSTRHAVRLRVWLNEESLGSAGIGFGVEVAGGDAAYIEADGVIAAWTTLTAEGPTTATGELTVRFGAFHSLAGTVYARLARFDSLTIEPVGPWDHVLIDAGVLYHEVAGVPVVLGVSRGGFTFDPGKEVELVQPDGAPSPIPTGRVRRYEPVISGTMLEFSDAQMAFFEPGNTETTATDVPFTWTPRPTGQVLTEGEYLTNVWLFLERGVSGYVRVAFARALCRKYTLVSKQGDEAEIAVEIAGVLPVGSPLGACPYTLAVFDVSPV